MRVSLLFCHHPPFLVVCSVTRSSSLSDIIWTQFDRTIPVIEGLCFFVLQRAAQRILKVAVTSTMPPTDSMSKFSSWRVFDFSQETLCFCLFYRPSFKDCRGLFLFEFRERYSVRSSPFVVSSFFILSSLCFDRTWNTFGNWRCPLHLMSQQVSVASSESLNDSQLLPLRVFCGHFEITHLCLISEESSLFISSGLIDS